MNQSEILNLLREMNAIIPDSHFVYTSGKHGRSYVNKDAIYPYPEVTSYLCQLIAKHFAHHEIDAVVAPAIGGVLLSQWVAYHLSQIRRKPTLALYAEKSEADEFELKRGYSHLCRGKKVLVVEDIINTGGSLKKVIQALRSHSTDIIGAACLCNRGQIQSHDLGDIPELFSLTEVKMYTWEAHECPLCEKGIPINTQVGKGQEFMRSQNFSF